jgi:hypothetical protein
MEDAHNEEGSTMNLIDIRRLEMLKRVRDFGAEHATDFPPDSPTGQMFADVTHVVDKLEQEAVTQYTGIGSSLESTQTRASARERLRETLQLFVITAQAVATAKGSDVDQEFRMPRKGDQRLITAAKAFAQQAAPLKADFVLHGMPDTFLDDLNAEIDDFDETVAAHTNTRESRAAARYGIDAALEEGLMAAVRLDAVVRNRMRQNGEALAKWQIAHHVDYPGRPHHLKTPVTPVAPTAPAPTPTSAPPAAV